VWHSGPDIVGRFRDCSVWPIQCASRHTHTSAGRRGREASDLTIQPPGWCTSALCVSYVLAVRLHGTGIARRNLPSGYILGHLTGLQSPSSSCERANSGREPSSDLYLRHVCPMRRPPDGSHSHRAKTAALPSEPPEQYTPRFLQERLRLSRLGLG
jgi:hypothetical protein